MLFLARQNGVKEKRLKRRGDMILGLFEAYWDGKLIQPTFVMDYPRETSGLAKPHRENPDLAERFECVVGGLEVMNCYTELNDPRIQRENFEREEQRRLEGDEEAPPTDEDFLTAMEYGFPPMGGIGISIDRFAMLHTNSLNIKDVIYFPPVKRASSARNFERREKGDTEIIPNQLTSIQRDAIIEG
jgi:lysyl-tRNA synthetase class 2